VLGVLGLTSGEFIGLGREVVELRKTWSEASRGNNNLLGSRRNDFRRLRFGTSFAPEQWTRDEQAKGRPLTALRFAVDELGMREIRLGFRWNRVHRGADIDLSYYRPYLDYCLSEGVNVCLNVGPIKTFRWPEEHVPGFILDRLDGIPSRGQTIDAYDGLANEAVDYLKRMLDRLYAEYGINGLGGITMLQPDNEPFFGFGVHEWRMTREYMRRIIEVLDSYFPERPLLLSSAARLNLATIQQLFFGLLGHDGRFEDRLVLGFNYHYRTPMRDSVPLIRHLDPIAFARPFEMSVEENLRAARSLGYRVEVAEGQAEPYHHLTSPGNSATDFRFMVIRCLDKVLDPREPGLIRVWGVEELSKKAIRREMKPDHREIVDLIQQVNFQAA
jgi:hypothetical protein